MNNQQTLLTALGCAGSLATMLAVSSSAIASPTSPTSVATSVATSVPTLSDEALAHMANYTVASLAQDESDPITDALSCSCTRCMLGEQRPIL